MTTEELRRLWNDKVTRGVALSDAEKGAFRAAYWAGRLPAVRDFSVQQWVEDGCRSFDSLDGRDG